MDVLTSDLHRGHETVEYARGRLAPSPECPERAEIISRALRDAGHSIVEVGDGRPADELLDLDSVGRVHTVDYVDLLRSAWHDWIATLGTDAAAAGATAFTWPRRAETARRPSDVVGRLGYHSFAGDSPIVEGTWRAVAASAALAQQGADAVLAGSEAVYALCRPPGHHATADQLGGYCYLNNAAIAAQRLLDRGVGRVGVVDVDYHHGNGTQSIFESRADVVTTSVHADTEHEFPWFSGHADEIGSGPGAGTNLNLPLPRGSGAATWHDTTERALAFVDDASVDAVVVALGVDTFEGDPLGTFALLEEDFVGLGVRLGGLSCPLVVLQEGGYAVDALGRNVTAVLDGIETARRVPDPPSGRG